MRRPRGQILPEEGAPTAEALRNLLEGEPATTEGGYNQRYFQANREPLNEKRRERRRKARARRAVEPIVEWMKEEAKRRAALPRLVGKPGERPRLLDPITGKTEYLC